MKADPDVVALEEAEGNTRKVQEALGWPHVSERSQLVSKLPLIDPPGADGMYEFVEIRPGRRGGHLQRPSPVGSVRAIRRP